MSKDERRQSTRVHFHTTANLQFKNKDFEGCETSDLAAKGVFVRGVKDQGMGEECSMQLHLVGASSDLVLSMQGSVVRVQEDGVAIKFHEIDLDSFYHLKNIVYYNSENPDELPSQFDPEVDADIDDQHFE